MLYRKMTNSGSVNIPAQLRREMGYKKRDVFEVELKDGVVIMRPRQPRCLFCGTTENVKLMRGKGICKSCLAKAKG